MPLDSTSIHSEYQKLISNIYDLTDDKSSTLIIFSSPVGLGKVAILSVILGILFGVHLTCLFTAIIPTTATIYLPIEWCIYVLAICIYHWNEFFFTALYHPESTSYDSFLVNQSREYQIAIGLGWIEYFIGMLIIPYEWKSIGKWLGILLIIIGQTCRSLAMITGGKSFTHLVAQEKKTHHNLVTHGIYQYLRHPSYFGWFWWSLGTQILLGNIICFVAYGIVALKFFRERIPIEEHFLSEFFPQYDEYKRKTWIGIPFL
jgi:protein-S-isoprenylcysteine O-methyltransferase